MWNEPYFSRLLIVAGVVVIGIGATLRIYFGSSHAVLSGFVFLGWAFMFILAAAGFLVVTITSVGGWSRRPVGFKIADKKFAVSAIPYFGYLGLFQVLVLANAVVFAVDDWRRPDDWPGGWIMTTISISVTALLAVLVVPLVALIWRGIRVELSTAGVESWLPWCYRMIPWDALSPGGPLRPNRSAERLKLITVRPDLVVQQGLSLGWGNKKQPGIPVYFNIHPWFLADAIRWYVEHPEHREAIGTQAEHDRLVSTLAPELTHSAQ